MQDLLTPTDAARDYGVNVPQGMEVIYNPLYDFQTYATGGATEFTFFQNPVGSSGKTIRDTNMLSAGQLPSPQRFLVQTVEVHFYQGADVWETAASGLTGEQTNDVYNVLKAGALIFTIGSKPYVTQAPLVTMPAANKFVAQFAIEDTTTTMQTNALYMAPAGPSYNLQAHKVPLWIPPNQNFDVKISFDAAIVVGTASRIGVRLGGILYRSRQ